MSIQFSCFEMKSSHFFTIMASKLPKGILRCKQMKQKLYAFFSGRNGIDELSRALLWGAIVGILVCFLIPNVYVRTVLYDLALIALVYSYIRAFSRKLDKRRAQNERYLSWKNFHKLRFQQRKTHKFYRCPKCRQQLRVPKGKGKISITCKCCGERFVKTT